MKTEPSSLALVLSPTSTIREALRLINEVPEQIAIILDGNQKVIGTVTDGDIRRFLLVASSLDARVSEVMNIKPILGHTTDDETIWLGILRKHGIKQLPLVDDSGRFKKLVTLDQLSQQACTNHWVVLMAGGRGSRLGKLTEQTPKPLLHVGGKPMLETIIKNLSDFGFHKFVISINYLGHKIEEFLGDGSKFGVEIKYLREENELGTAGALSLLESTCGKPSLPVIVMNGDILTRMDFRQLMNAHSQTNPDITVCTRPLRIDIPYGVVHSEARSKTVKKIEEKPSHEYWINAGVYVLSPETILELKAGHPIDMPQLINLKIESNRQVLAHPIRDYWIDVGREPDLLRADDEFGGIFSK